MEIKLKTLEEEKIILTDDGLDNDNFVSLFIKDEEHIISIDDLYSALLSFRNVRKLNYERDKLYKNNNNERV